MEHPAVGSAMGFFLQRLLRRIPLSLFYRNRDRTKGGIGRKWPERGESVDSLVVCLANSLALWNAVLPLHLVGPQPMLERLKSVSPHIRFTFANAFDTLDL